MWGRMTLTAGHLPTGGLVASHARPFACLIRRRLRHAFTRPPPGAAPPPLGAIALQQAPPSEPHRGSWRWPLLTGKGDLCGCKL